MILLNAAVLATALTISGGAPASPAPVPTVETASDSSIVEGNVYSIGWFGSTNIGELRCGFGQKLDDKEYHPGSGARIPRGVELRGGDLSVLDASIGARSYNDRLGGVPVGAGGWDSSVTNWKLGDNWVQMVLHCTG
jgi:hypothetical protein